MQEEKHNLIIGEKKAGSAALKESIIVVDSQFPINRKLEQLFKHIQFIKNLEIKKTRFLLNLINYILQETSQMSPLFP